MDLEKYLIRVYGYDVAMEISQKILGKLQDNGECEEDE